MSEPRPVYTVGHTANTWPTDPSLAILLHDLVQVCLYSGAEQITILRDVRQPTLAFERAGLPIKLAAGDAGVLVIIRFPTIDDAANAASEHYEAEDDL